MLLGKFLPLHRGHVHLIDVARRFADELTVLVCSLAAEPIPGALRHRWVAERFPDCRVLHVTDENPQEPHEHPAFWSIWKETIRRRIPEGEGPDLVFASDAYGRPLAELLGARWIPVDPGRELHPVSGTMIREDPMAHWDQLAEVCRPHFVRRVCLVGPESTGKSILARRLAAHFATVHVHEWARPYLETRGNEVRPEDFAVIFRGQAAAEASMAREARRLLFVDTDALTTRLYHEFLVGPAPGWLVEGAAATRYDLTLLCDVDCPWTADPQRFFPDERREHFRRFREALDGVGRPYAVLGGTWEERFVRAVELSEGLLASRRT